MKCFYILALMICFSALAQTSDAVMRTFRNINELNGSTFEYQACSSQDPNAPVYCKNPHQYICAQKKSDNFTAKLDEQLIKDYWQQLGRAPSKKMINETFVKTMNLVETKTQERTGIKTTDINQAMNEVKTTMIKFIQDTTLIRREYKRDMIERISEVVLVPATGYVDLLVDYGKTQSPQTSEEDLRYQAIEMYMSSCGVNGLETNAFYMAGMMVVCPGIIASMSDYQTSKEQMLTALKFTLGHEIGHAIDAGVKPAVYMKMKDCYKQISGDPTIWDNENGNEISADYWGALALGSQLDPTRPEVNARTLALSVDGICGLEDSEFRFNQILAKHPYLARALNCSSTTREAPFCSLNGSYSP